MTRVKNRNMPPVNGWQHFEPRTGWSLAKNAPHAVWDFGLSKSAIIQHRKSNPRFGLPTDDATVGNQLDEENALRMLSIPGAEAYVQVDPANLPKSMPQHDQGQPSVVGSVSKVAAGVTAIVSWLKSGAEAVPQELANNRAAICSTCPKNDRGDWTSMFTVPAQTAIRAAMNQRKEWKLVTSHDAKLNVCSACLCPLPLKVHMPITAIKPKMPKESFDDLDPRCWIRSESA